MTLNGNKGEWGEFYAFIKLLADGKIYGSDANLNKTDDLFYLVIKILRGQLQYVEKHQERQISIIDNDGAVLKTVSTSDLENYSKTLYRIIALGKKGERAFSSDEAIEIMHCLQTSSLSDERKQTADIRMVIHDPITQHEPLLGFSIKSYIGSKPTLFNASKSTNIIYQITPDLSADDIERVNSFNTYSNRIDWLINNGFTLKYKKLNKDLFNANLSIIDSLMPELLSYMVLYKFTMKVSKMDKIDKLLSTINPMNYNLSVNPNFYNYKIKRLLVDMALGMKAGELWEGNFNADGGCIAVKNSGELVCFHLYNWNVFQEYLFNSTKFDCPDSNTTRCDYGRILYAADVAEETGTYIKLNFQIRFI